MNYLINNNRNQFKKIRVHIGFFILIVPLVYMLDPSDSSWGMNKIIILKYLPIILVLMGLATRVFSGIQLSLNFSIVYISIFFLLMFSGGLFTFFQEHNLKESFLGRSISILAFFWGSFFWTRERGPTMLKFGYYLIYASIIMGIMVFLWRLGFRFVDKPHIFHEEVFVFYGSFIASYYIFRNRYLFNFYFLFCILSALLTFKNTGFLIVFLMILHRLYIQYREFNELVIKRILFFSLLLFTIVLVYWFLINFSNLLPSGSPEVRLKTYELRLDMFLENFWFGSFFTGSPLLELKTFFGSIIIPSHSDVMDILAFGGIISLFLFFSPVLILFFRFLQVSTLNGYSKEIKYLCDLSVAIVVSLLVIMIVNPVLNQPHIAILYWFFLGLGLSCVGKKYIATRRK